MEKEWLAAFSRMTYGIYVLTAAFEDKINGMIASWVSQVSYDPPVIIAAVHPGRYSHELIKKSKCFALHVISRDQKDFLKRFKGPDPAAKFTDIEWIKGKTGSPVINDCSAWFECEVINSFAPGNHTVFIGQVVNAKNLSSSDVMSTADYEGVYIGKS
ncbi:FMN-binding protein [Desulfonema limicola]|uniref:FMN-binding protein n=1 Tax=Desulfonema limicola TaxID=45656 RepID=A0A975BEN1_9BACT|nr:flavin reductase family protein [Desulfonema limicola]QTA83710.1 FMN-binding protein [Desulfonema limicola]